MAAKEGSAAEEKAETPAEEAKEQAAGKGDAPWMKRKARRKQSQGK